MKTLRAHLSPPHLQGQHKVLRVVARQKYFYALAPYCEGRPQLHRARARQEGPGQAHALGIRDLMTASGGALGSMSVPFHGTRMHAAGLPMRIDSSDEAGRSRTQNATCAPRPARLPEEMGSYHVPTKISRLGRA